MRFTLLQGILYTVNIATAVLLASDLGILKESHFDVWVDVGYFLLAAATLVLTILRNKEQVQVARRDRVAVWLLSVILIPCTLAALRNAVPGLVPYGPYMEQIYLVLIFLYLLYALSRATRLLYSGAINAMVLFAGSFAIVILIGSFLLTLPLATTTGISYIDALFTSTSAVSVTGLAVVDTGTTFTLFGQSVILALIQVGGLGILTFTSFFAYFFQSGNSFREGMVIRDMISSETLGNVLGLAARIVGFTLTIELIGAVLIFWTSEPFASDMTLGERMFFALFHSVASFCNAGFSTLPNNLYEGAWRFNYNLQWVVIIMLIIGGLGFNIIFNFFVYLKTFLKKLYNKIRYRKQIVMPVRLITLNAKIVLTTTGILLLVGTVVFFFTEYGNSLKEHQTWFGKFTTAFFMSATPRTGGFNTVDYTALTIPTLMVTLLFMWIGASPASTGGGIKTTTFALATLNILAIARGKRRIELASRQISSLAVNRAFAILCLSLIVLGFSVMFVSLFEPQLGLMKVAFECFSAFGTVGLSMGVTPTLSPPSKIVIILTMYIGRIGMINILVGMLRQMNAEYYQYPKEDILIN
ncbi:MAG: potassium transporter [Saprospirales bacterium]|jgi:trk system potassium uptake protein TrkH|nr:potassium transporter [Saprospirales bacterium]MBK7336931.1 potassium transporter [Saprospirales bacterium]